MSVTRVDLPVRRLPTKMHTESSAIVAGSNFLSCKFIPGMLSYF
jgi:hypothetical protein